MQYGYVIFAGVDVSKVKQKQNQNNNNKTNKQTNKQKTLYLPCFVSHPINRGKYQTMNLSKQHVIAETNPREDNT